MLSVRRAAALVAAPCLVGMVASAGSSIGPEAHAPQAFIDAAPRLALAGAQAVLDAAIEKARSLGAAPSIAVVDEGGHLLCFVRLDGAFPAGSAVSIGKACTAATFHKPTSAFEDAINKGRTAMAGLDGLTPLQGGVPVRTGERFIGGIGVSGAASAAEDELIALAGAAALSSPASTSHPR